MNARPTLETKPVTGGHAPELPAAPIASDWKAVFRAPPASRLPSSPTEGKPAWYAARITGNREREVKKELQPVVAEVLLPTTIDRSRVRRQRKRTAKLFLPGFVFIRAVLTDELYQAVRGVRGVAAFVGTVQTRKVAGVIESTVYPARIPDRQMQVLIDQMDADGVIARVEALPADLKDKLLRVVDGPFTSFPGICEWHDTERGRLKVTVNLFGRACPLELDETQVALV